MTPCTHSDSGCNHPESQCAGLCTKPKLRFFPRPKPDIDLSVGDDEPVNRFRLALNTFNLWHRHGCGLRQSLSKALLTLPEWLVHVAIFIACFGIGGLILAGLIYFFG